MCRNLQDWSALGGGCRFAELNCGNHKQGFSNHATCTLLKTVSPDKEKERVDELRRVGRGQLTSVENEVNLLTTPE
jgi:hypothetical protein